MNSRNSLHRLENPRRKPAAARSLLLFAATLVMGCAATTTVEEDDTERKGPIDDFIAVAELKKTHSLKPIGSIYHQPITYLHIILRDRRNTYLVEFDRPCKALDEREIPPQITPHPGRFRVALDAYRGCSFRSVYPLNEEQEQVLLELIERARQ